MLFFESDNYSRLILYWGRAGLIPGAILRFSILFYVGHCCIRVWKQGLIHPLFEFVSIIFYDMRGTVHISHGYYNFVVDGGDGGCKLDAMGVVGGGGGEGEGI